MDLVPAFGSVGIALALGLLVGLQRERDSGHIAGIRTFPLITVLGAISAALAEAHGGWIAGVAMLGVIASAVIGNLHKLRGGEVEHGITTEIAMIVMFVVGALVWQGWWALGVVIGGGVAVLLHAKPILHGFARRLGEPDVRAIMQFALVTMVILPVLPDRTWGGPPLDVLNPRHVWMMVVLVVGISLGGYVAYKWLGAGAGLLLAGLLGGAVSSTATTVSYARRARDAADNRGVALAAAVVIVVSSTVVYARVLIEIAAAAPRHAAKVGAPIALLGGVSALLALVAWIFCARRAEAMPEQSNPAEMKSALTFGLLYAVVLLAVAAARQYLDQRGLYAVAALSGLTDMDAITLSAARLTQEDRLTPDAAWRSIVVASVSNQLFKLGIVGWMGGGRLLRIAGIFFGVKLVAAGLVLALWPAAAPA